MRKLLDLKITEENRDYVYFTITTEYRNWLGRKRNVDEECFRDKGKLAWNYHAHSGGAYNQVNRKLDNAITAMFKREYYESETEDVQN